MKPQKTYRPLVSDGNARPGRADGGTSVVYPGENGPVDSVRREGFSESLKTCALLETLGILFSSCYNRAEIKRGADPLR